MAFVDFFVCFFSIIKEEPVAKYDQSEGVIAKCDKLDSAVTKSDHKTAEDEAVTFLRSQFATTNDLKQEM